MTAEVAILNKLGVALAADSTVTITTSNGDKTYNTTNKLFTLSKYHPVGIMIWNSTEFNTVPFELIIKEFRESLGKKSKATLGEYADLFIRHLKTRAHVSKAAQLHNFKGIVRNFCRSLRQDFLSVCRDAKVQIIVRANLSGQARDIFNDLLDTFETTIVSEGKNPNLKTLTPAKLAAAYPGIAKEAIRQHLAPIQPTSAQNRRLITLLHRAALSNIITDDFTGLVFAGYGSSEYYPTVLDHKTDGMFANRLKLTTRRIGSVDRKRCLAPTFRMMA
jgi:hypothetical protein